MNTTLTRFTLLASTIATLSACAPMAPQPGTSYTPPVTSSPVPHPNPNPTPPVANPNPVPQQQYVVQLTASSSQTKAQNIRNTFAGKGYNAFVSPLMVNGRQLYRVQIGYYTNKADAEATLNQMRQQNPSDIYVEDAIVKTP
uniref:SPOR domain-containing protein n=1 Tax=uncultured Thiotrichaceae bacterium TaxID=298394 RepID=A0A6S6UFE4_9GAMM|nr:MAG: Unknown protein [uncultured Thiotrichaceae bacterium]